MISPLDTAVVQFSPDTLRALNLAQALMMFIVSLYLDGAALREARRFPRAVLVGLAAQWLLLPLLTLLLILALGIPAAAAVGLLLVAVCPGGGAAGFLSLLARGNIAVSVSITAVTVLATALLTPVVFAVTTALAGFAADGRSLHIDPWVVLETALLLLVLPLLSGLALRRLWPGVAQRIRGPLKALLGVLLAVAIGAALYTHGHLFLDYGPDIAPWIVLHNTAALAGAYALAWLARLPEADRRSIAIGAGVTNTNLSLLLVFSFFGGAAATAVVAAAWGAWRLVSGGLLALFWSRWPPSATPQPDSAAPVTPAPSAPRPA